MNLSEMQRLAVQRKIGDVVEIMHTATVMHVGWEMDNKVWVVRMKGGSIKLLTTSHGGLYETDRAELYAMISTTKDSLESLYKAERVLDTIRACK